MSATSAVAVPSRGPAASSSKRRREDAMAAEAVARRGRWPIRPEGRTGTEGDVARPQGGTASAVSATSQHQCVSTQGSEGDLSPMGSPHPAGAAPSGGSALTGRKRRREDAVATEEVARQGRQPARPEGRAGEESDVGRPQGGTADAVSATSQHRCFSTQGGTLALKAGKHRREEVEFSGEDHQGRRRPVHQHGRATEEVDPKKEEGAVHIA